MKTRANVAGSASGKGAEPAGGIRRLLGYGGVAAVVVGGVATGVVLGAATGDNEPTPERSPLYSVRIPSSSRQVGVPLADAGCSEVTEPELQPSRVLAPEESHPPYSSTPPTSGPHSIGSLNAAIYWIPHEPEAVVANLAEGDVVVWHTGFDTREEQNELKGLFAHFRSEEILAVPGDPLGLKHPIVLTAWGKLQECQRFSGQAIERFFNEHKGLGPGLG